MMNMDSIHRKIERALKNKKVCSEKEANKVLMDMFTQHNAEMDRVNQKLGGGLGTFLDKADKLIHQEKHSEAIKECDLILDAYPMCDEALLMKMTSSIATDDYENADSCFDRYIKLDPDNPEVYVLKWQLELEKVFKSGDISAENFRKTISFLNLALEIDPRYFDALISKAQILFWLGDNEYKKTILKCRKIDATRTKDFMEKHWIEEVPDCHPLSVMNSTLKKIECLMKQNDYQQAIDLVDSVVDKDMDQGLKEVLYSLKIECLICLRDYSSANLAITNLISLNKDYPKSYFHQGVIHFNCSEFNKALEAINQCITTAEKVSLKHPQYYLIKAEILKKLDKKGWQEFEIKAKEIEAENTKMLNRLCKEKGIDPKDLPL